MRERLIELLNDIDEDIVSFEGDDLFEAGIIDSFTVIEIVDEIETKFHIEIESDDVIKENLCTVDNMIKMVEAIIKRNVI